MSPPDTPPARGQGFTKLLLVFALVAVTVSAFLALKVWVWDKYDPTVLDRPDVKEAVALRAARQNGPLSDPQFQRAVELLASNSEIAQLAAIAVVQLEGAENPERKGAAVAALEGCGETAPEKVAAAAKQAAERLRGKQP